MILSRLQNLIPRWMQNAASIQFSQVMATLASLGDGMVAGVLDARYAWLPGQLDVPGGSGFDSFDAIPLILRDRYLREGFLESPFSKADRARRWQDEWARSATPAELLDQLAAILSPDPPLMRLVNGGGVWWERQTDGSFFQQVATGAGFFYQIDNSGNASITAEPTVTPAWDWDSAANPHPFGWGDPNRFWVIIYAPCNGPLLASDSGTIGDGRTIGVGLGGPNATTVGTVAPWKEAELIRGVIHEWRAAGLRCSHIIIAFDPDSFKVDGSSLSYPDGTWGWPCKLVANVMSPARDLSARYWCAEPGSIAGSL